MFVCCSFANLELVVSLLHRVIFGDYGLFMHADKTLVTDFIFVFHSVMPLAVCSQGNRTLVTYVTVVL